MDVKLTKGSYFKTVKGRYGYYKVSPSLASCKWQVHPRWHLKIGQWRKTCQSKDVSWKNTETNLKSMGRKAPWVCVWAHQQVAWLLNGVTEWDSEAHRLKMMGVIWTLKKILFWNGFPWKVHTLPVLITELDELHCNATFYGWFQKFYNDITQKQQFFLF